jgi:hypothetical protein
MPLFTGSARDLALVAALKSGGLNDLEPQLRAEVKLRREQFDREARLYERVFEPLGKLLDQPGTRAALEELFELHKAARLRSEPASGGGFRLRPPLQINTQPGSTATKPPLDGAWTDPNSNGTVAADKDAGTAQVDLSAGTGNVNAFGAAWVELWVLPQSAENVVVLTPHLHVTFRAQVLSLGSFASTDGYLKHLLVPHDGFPGNVIPNLVQNFQSRLWSAGSSGPFDNPPPLEADYEDSPSFVLRGGAWYDVYFWIISTGFATGTSFGGLSSSVSSLKIGVDLVEAVQA